jgi:hypothetical protein
MTMMCDCVPLLQQAVCNASSLAAMFSLVEEVGWLGDLNLIYQARDKNNRN